MKYTACCACGKVASSRAPKTQSKIKINKYKSKQSQNRVKTEILICKLFKTGCVDVRILV
ncbi:hypothetical protein CG394_06825 [Gardnerella vaginalis]|nr:hypothetical protein EGX90_06065 [Gardnerella vaginalis]TCH82412.1 hypothetical protein E0E46_03315 [Gardnerella vaginalis ATCC 14018 = JCM 11026]PKZ45458.1 hypothetical protein CYJ68_05065 [Gardnerella vaginalis]PKZ56950.1 hypothetical protein CYJ63_05590 [Gardnerella vaginalis]PKZ74964.1 hypothetical protein CYJ65_03630 [Gardnerella vaginalis]